MTSPKFSFFTIVFNGDDFIRESLRSVYAFAHEIFIIEGAVRECWEIANPDGSSTDATTDIIRSFPDPQGKIRVFQGKWENKEQMTNVPLPHVTGDYVWQLDSDEAYKEEDLPRLARLIQDSPDVSCVYFKTIDFFQGFDRIMVGKNDHKRSSHLDRIWRFKKGSRFIGHRPPDLYCPGENKFMGQGKRLDGEWLAATHGIYLYHYSYVTDKQVRDKMVFYPKVYLKNYPIGIPFWRFIRHLPLIRVFYAWIFMRPAFIPLRKKLAFPEMNLNYVETVWEPWKRDREAVENRYGVTFNSADPFITIPFEGTHPQAMQERVRRR